MSNDGEFVSGPMDEASDPVDEASDPVDEASDPVDEASDPVDEASDLDTLLSVLASFNVEYTLIQDEHGAAIECRCGDRLVRGYRGLSVMYSFAPSGDFIFMGVL